MEKIRDLSTNIIKNYGIIIEFILVLIFLIFSYQLICDKKYLQYISIHKICVIIALFPLILITIAIQIKYYYKVLEKMFLIFVIPVGLAFLIFVLPGYVYDENTHIIKIYDISNGNLVSKKDESGYASIKIPSQYQLNASRALNNSYNTTNELIKEKFNYNDILITNQVIGNSFILYLPASIVFFIGRLLELNFFLLIYVARIANFIIFLLLGYYAIKIIPFGKIILFAYLLIPMVIHQAVSLSADSLVNSILIYFLAYNLYLFKTNIKITKKNILVYYLLVATVVACKVAYFPLVLLSLLISSRKDISIKSKGRFLIGVFLIFISTLFLVSSITPNYEDYKNYEEYNNIDSEAQFLSIFADSFNYVKVMYNTIEQNAYMWLQLFIGIAPNQAYFTGNEFIVLLYIITLIVSAFYSNEKIFLKRKEKLLFFGIFIFSTVNILSGLYIVWTPVNAEIIQGITGRYFIPIIILLLLMLKSKKKCVASENITTWIIIFAYLINVNILLENVKYFLI